MRIHFDRLADEGPLEAAWNDVQVLTVMHGTAAGLCITEVNDHGVAELRIERTTGEVVTVIPMGYVCAVD